jgi:ribosomal-protein-alanine N-acetyltransferase
VASPSGKIEGELPMEERRIFLKLLSEQDVTEKYLSWMADGEVMQYLESRWFSHTVDSIRGYVKRMNESPNDFLFGIFDDEFGHIGNIKIGGINQLHRFGDVGLVIGEKAVRGRGYGTKAIQMATEYAFKELNLNKLTAGMYANNVASHKAFLKAGYRQVGYYEKHWFCQGKYVDGFLMERLRP